MMSCLGQMRQRLRPIDRRHAAAPGRTSFDARIRSSCDVLGGNIGPHLILLAIEPGDEQHLHRAAAIPVALLIIRTDAAHARAEALRDHRGVMPDCPCAATPSCHSAVDEQPMVPTLPLDQGCDDIQLIASSPSVSGAPENIVVAFGEEMAALVHLHVGVAALDGVEFGASCRAARRCARPSS